MSGVLVPADGDPNAPPLQADPRTGAAAYNPGGGPDAGVRFDNGEGRLNPAQTAFLRAYQGKGYDPHAPAGSIQHPLGMGPNSPNPLGDPKNFPNGTWVVDYDGQMKQIVDDVRDPGHPGQRMFSAPGTIVPAQGAQPVRNGPPVGWGEDVLRSTGTGAEKAVAGTLGGGGDINNVWGHAVLSGYSHALGALQDLGDKAGLDLTSQAFPDQRPSAWEKKWGTPMPTATMDAQGNLQNGWSGATAPDNLNFAHLNGQITSQDVGGLEEKLFGPQWQPQTSAGRLAETVGENLPAALLPGGPAARLSRVALPSLTGWGAGELAQGTPFEPYAKIGGTVLGGGLQGLGEGLGRRSETLIGDAIPRSVTADQIDAAVRLRNAAQARGQSMSIAEALQWETNGATGLGRLQRLSENFRNTQPGWAQFYAERPTQQANMIGNFVDSIAPPGVSAQDLQDIASTSPGMAGLRAQTAARGALNTADAQRRAAAQAAGYSAADGQEVNSDLINALVQRVRSRVAQDPRGPASGVLSNFANDLIAEPAVPGVAPTRVAGPNGIFRTTPGTPGTPEVPLTNIGDLSARENNWQHAISGDPARMDTPSKFEAGALGPYLGDLRRLLQTNPDFAAGEQEFANQTANLVDPLKASPVGGMDRTQDLGTQLSRLFQQNPYPGASADTTRAISALQAEDPLVAAILARKHVGGTFDQMTRELTSGPNQYGGARFRSAIMGNPGQSDVLNAALGGIDPTGATNTNWDEIQNLLGATGMRERAGSLTAFNKSDEDALKLAPFTARSLGNLIDPMEWGQHLNKAIGSSLFDQTNAGVARLLQDDDTRQVLLDALANRSNPARTAVPIALPTLLQLQDQSQ